MSDERVRCVKCERWMFHLAQRCPHCGAVQPGRAGAKLEKLTAEEARSLLEVVAPSPRSFLSVAREFIAPRSGKVDLVLSVLAAPLTVLAVATTGWLVRFAGAEASPQLEVARVAAVPMTALLGVTVLVELPAPGWGYALWGTTFLAWALRTWLRR